MQQLKNPMIFVFGSNESGRHGAGAALFAARFHGAERGVGLGITGNSYAIPTKNGKLESLTIGEVSNSIKQFIEFARNNPDKFFQVTRIGCGLAGFPDDQISPLFAGAPDNCLLPGKWIEAKNKKVKRVIVAGGRDFEDYALLDKKLSLLLSASDKSSVEIVSGCAKGADRLGQVWAKEHGYKCVEFPAPWEALKKSAGFFRNEEMAWYGTHLIAFWDGESSGTKHMIETARRDGMPTRVVMFEGSNSLGKTDKTIAPYTENKIATEKINVNVDTSVSSETRVAATPEVAMTSDFEPHWIELVRKMNPSGLLKQALEQSEVVSWAADVINVRVPIQALASDSIGTGIKRLLKETCGHDVTVAMNYGSVKSKTVSKINADDYNRRVEEATAMFMADPFVKSMIEQFGAKLVEVDSVGKDRCAKASAIAPSRG